MTLGEYINLEGCVKHIKEKIKTDPGNENLLGNYYLQKYMFRNKTTTEYKNLSDYEIEKYIKEQAKFDLLLNDELNKIEYTNGEDLIFLDDVWNIIPPEKEEDDFEPIQEIALILADLQDGEPDALAGLCCAYVVRLRGGEKLTGELVKDIPLTIAFKVKKMLETYVDLLCSLKKIY